MSTHTDESALGVLVLAELADGIEALPPGKKRTRLARQLEFLQEDYADQILAFDECCAWEWARYCHEVRNSGQSPALMDSLIAAMARAWGLTVVTGNTRDFPLIATLNPFEL